MGKRQLIHLPDLQFVRLCQREFGINRGLYNTVDEYFFRAGLEDITVRRSTVLAFFADLLDRGKMNKHGRMKPGPNGLSSSLADFWHRNAAGREVWEVKDVIHSPDPVWHAERIAILYDDLDGHIGYFIGAAGEANQHAVNFMTRHGRGLIYVCTTHEQAQRLQLPVIGETHPQHKKTFAVSVDYKTTTTGISARERADTIKAFTDPHVSPDDFKRPGHIFPLISKNNRLLDRLGIAEAAVQLAEWKHKQPFAYVCDILNEQGQVATGREIKALAVKFGLRMWTFSELLTEMTDWFHIEHQCVLDQERVTMYTGYDRYEQNRYSIYIRHASERSDRIVYYTECHSGDLLGLRRCHCAAHFKDYYVQLLSGQIDAIVYGRHDQAAPGEPTMEGIRMRQMEVLVRKLSDKHRQHGLSRQGASIADMTEYVNVGG